MAKGWVSIHRTLLEKGWSNKPEYLALWIHLILKATHKTIETFWNGKVFKLSEGQFITGRNALGKETGIHPSKIERILKTFEIEQQIEQQKTNTSRLITILNYAKYQNGEQQSGQRVNNKRTLYNNDNNTNTNSIRANKKFVPPTVNELTQFIIDKSQSVPKKEAPEVANRIHDFYTSKGWKVGRNSMKDWKAATRNWIRNQDQFKKTDTSNIKPNSDDHKMKEFYD